VNQNREFLRIVDYDPGWPAEFERERKRLIQALGDLVVAVEHIGSTAVPGLAAKPIIDIAVAVRDLGHADECTPIIEDLGYQRHPAGDFEGRLFFRCLAGGVPTHHLSVTERSTDFWRDHLLFRDYLRQHPDAARTYGDLKKRLAAEYGSDRAGYTYAKTSFIEKVVGRGWIGQPPA
jgi:GrpB-like predicted nucleotidyltransferase (UPF0157 family)